jgi:hypothetical protein
MAKQYFPTRGKKRFLFSNPVGPIVNIDYNKNQRYCEDVQCKLICNTNRIVLCENRNKNFFQSINQTNYGHGMMSSLPLSPIGRQEVIYDV